MKLVFTKEEVASALGKSSRRFDELRPALEADGFPKPVPGLGACWSILQVSQWVNRNTAADPLPSLSAETGGEGAHTPSPSIIAIQEHLVRRYSGTRA